MDILRVKVNNEWTDIPALVGPQGESGNDPNAVHFNESQNLTEAQKNTARNNIGAASTGDITTILANFAGAFVQATAYPAGTYVTYTDGNLYILPNGHEANTTWANTAKTQVSVGEELSELKSAINHTNDKINAISEQGVNLLPYGKWEMSIGGVNVTYENGEVKRVGTSVASMTWGAVDGLIALPVGTYTLFVVNQTSNAYELRDLNGTKIVDAETKTFTLSEPKTLQLFICIQASGITFNDTKQLQLNVGGSAEAWKEVTVTAVDKVVRDSLERINSDIEEIKETTLELIGGQVYPKATQVSQMYNSSGNLVNSTDTYKFYEVDGLSDVSVLKLDFQNGSGGYTTHYFNQFDSSNNLLSYTPFYSSDDTYTVNLDDNCTKIRVLVYVSNGTFSPNYTKQGIVESGYKKLSALGDSITYGYTADGNITDTYAKQIADKLGCDFQRLGIISTPICPNSDYTDGQNDDAFVYRWNQIASDADLIIVAGGTNDYGHNVPLGTATDGNSQYETTFYGALNYLITNIVSTYPNARLVFVTPFHRQGDYQQNSQGKTLADYADAIKTKCIEYGIACVDGYSYSGINTVQAFMDVNLNDGLHPTQDGHNLIYKNLMPYFAML